MAGVRSELPISFTALRKSAWSRFSCFLRDNLDNSAADTLIAPHGVHEDNVMDAWKKMLEAGQKALAQHTATDGPEVELRFFDSEENGS